MPEISDIIGKALSLFVMAILGLVGYVVKGHDGRMSKVEKDVSSLSRYQVDANEKLSEYKLDSERRYAKEETLQSSLARIHDRLDAHAADTDRNFDGLRTDIKTLLGR